MVVKPDDLVTVKEAARECKRTMETVRRWIWGGKLPAQKLGNQLFVKRVDLARLVDRAYKQATSNDVDVLEELRANREKIARRIGGTLDIIRMLDESRESHP